MNAEFAIAPVAVVPERLTLLLRRRTVLGQRDPNRNDVTS
jgi:hypothetical protein